MSAEIDDCKYLYLRELTEPRDNSLRLEIEEAKSEGPPENFEVSPGNVIPGCRSIESDESCRLFVLVWETYVCYSVRNESFCTLDDAEAWEGRLLCLYKKSHFLDYVARATFASDEYPGLLRHWGINCLNHVIDVVSACEPQVRRIRPI